MSKTVSKNALIKRIRRVMKRRNWSLVVARDNWWRNDQFLGSYYMIDSNGNVVNHRRKLLALARDLRVLREGETVGQGGVCEA